MSLQVWFRAIWWVVSQKNGASALGLKRVLGLGSYETAWLWLHKLRRAMVSPEREPLSGEVEVDETIIGGPEKRRRGRKIKRKALVVIAAECRGNGIGRVRMSRIPNASAEELQAFISPNVAKGSILRTDGWRGYCGVEKIGYSHVPIPVTTGRNPKNKAISVLPRVHRVASLLQRWLLGTHQGAVTTAHIDYYLDEFTFRFNRRTSRSRGKLFYRLLQNAVRIKAPNYEATIRHVRGRGRNSRRS